MNNHRKPCERSGTKKQNTIICPIYIISDITLTSISGYYFSSFYEPSFPCPACALFLFLFFFPALFPVLSSFLSPFPLCSFYPCNPQHSRHPKSPHSPATSPNPQNCTHSFSPPTNQYPPFD